jgi:AcrR family transcriptional regulator
VERAEPVAHFRGIVAQRLANIEAAARYALIVGGGVAISTAVARPAPGEQTVPTSRCNARVSTRDRLIDSMRALLWERGYLGTSPKAIQQRAGAGQGSMYHHFAGKEDLAHVAITGTAAQMRAAVDEQLSGPGNAFDRIAGYLNRERDVLRGCPIGRLTQDTDVLSTPVLRAPIADTFAWLRTRLADVVREGIERDELDPGLDPAAVASMIAAILQGGYVLARAAASPEPFDEAVAGVLGLLAAHSARG